MNWCYTKVLYTSMRGGSKGSFTPSLTLPNRAAARSTMYAKERSLTSTHYTGLSGHTLTHTHTHAPSLSKPNVCPLCRTMHRTLPEIKSYLNIYRKVEVNRTLHQMHNHTYNKLIYLYNYFNILKQLAYYIT